MKKSKAIRQLKDLRRYAEGHRLHDAREGAAEGSVWAQDVEALDMAIKALRAPRQDVPTWACIFACIALGAVIAACIIYSIT